VCSVYLTSLSPCRKAGALRRDAVHLFVCLSVCSFVCRLGRAVNATTGVSDVYSLVNPLESPPVKFTLADRPPYQGPVCFVAREKSPQGKNSSLKFMLAAGALVVPQFVTSANEADVMWSFCLSFRQQDN